MPNPQPSKTSVQIKEVFAGVAQSSAKFEILHPKAVFYNKFPTTHYPNFPRLPPKLNLLKIIVIIRANLCQSVVPFVHFRSKKYFKKSYIFIEQIVKFCII